MNFPEARIAQIMMVTDCTKEEAVHALETENGDAEKAIEFIQLV